MCCEHGASTMAQRLHTARSHLQQCALLQVHRPHLYTQYLFSNIEDGSMGGLAPLEYWQGVAKKASFHARMKE